MNKIYFSFLVILFSSCFPHINYMGTVFLPQKSPISTWMKEALTNLIKSSVRGIQMELVC